MEHAEIHELSAAYALDALEPEQRVEFEEHLLRCAECRETVSLFQETAAALAYGVETPAASPALGRRIMEQLAVNAPTLPRSALAGSFPQPLRSPPWPPARPSPSESGPRS
jgi:anti-sigma-K factor RskA